MLTLLISASATAQIKVEWFAQQEISEGSSVKSINQGLDGDIFVSGPYFGGGAPGGFIASYSANGILRWRREFPSSGPSAIPVFNAIDNLGNVIIAGQAIQKYDREGTLLFEIPGTNRGYYKGLDIDPTTNDILVVGYKSYVDSSFADRWFPDQEFIARFSSSGELRYLKPFYLTYSINDGFSFKIGPDGSIYSGGCAAVALTKPPPLPNGQALEVGPGYILKMNENADLVWFRAFKSEIGAPCVKRICVSKSGDLYTLAESNRPFVVDDMYIDFVVKNGTTTIDYDVFIAKFNSEGVCQWVRSGGNENMDVGQAIVADDAGYVFTTGRSRSPGTLRFENQTWNPETNEEWNMFLTQYDSDGNVVSLTGSKYGGSEGTALACNGKDHYWGGMIWNNPEIAGTKLDQPGNSLLFKFSVPNFPTSVSPDSEVSSQIVFPNPSKDGIYTIRTGQGMQNASVKIYNTQARLIYSDQLPDNANQVNIQLKAAPGVYLLELQSGTKRQTQRIILEN